MLKCQTVWFKPWRCHAGLQSGAVVSGSRFKESVAQTGALNISEPLGLGPTGNKVKSTFRRSPSKTQTYLLITYLLKPFGHGTGGGMLSIGVAVNVLMSGEMMKIQLL